MSRIAEVDVFVSDWGDGQDGVKEAACPPLVQVRKNDRRLDDQQHPSSGHPGHKEFV